MHLQLLALTWADAGGCARCCIRTMYAVDYLSTSCNEALLDCLARLREGTSTFDGNKCMIDEVIDVITVVIEAAVVAGRVLHKP